VAEIFARYDAGARFQTLIDGIVPAPG